MNNIIKKIESIDLNYNLIVDIYNNYYKKFYRLAYKRTGNIENAKDITQNTMEAICKRVGKKNNIYNLNSWLYTILKYKCYDIYKKKNRIQYYANDVLENYLIEDEINEIENIDLYDTLKGLNDLERKMVICRFVYGFKNSEIANFCNCSYSAVKRKLDNSLKILKEKLE